ncbi:ankyrin repeat protein [Colletotrichum tofieldiae]|uniref:Ankyrin repeat protein n=1 Tax=Colletotrichum tofieldiae TaxID=708197 RepID=A0A161WGS4_9PEZI|nr:ankyrin repeat protein [Colletotrichum tofieldiae]
MAKRVSLTPEMTHSPTHILLLAASANASMIFETLLRLDIEAAFAKGDSPLHHLSRHATVDFVRRLKSIYPDACSFPDELHGRIPLESYLRKCLEAGAAAEVDPAVLDELSPPESPATNALKGKIWQDFAQNLVQIMRSSSSTISTLEKEATTLACQSLIRLGYLQSYELWVSKSSLIPLLEPLQRNFISKMSDLAPASSGLFCQIIKQTGHWADIERSQPLVRLLKAAVRSCDLDLVNLLLSKGAEWIIGELVQRGADPDVRVDRTPHYPALVYYTITKRIDYATALLKNGADPSHICLRGFDAALAATQIGSVSFLSELYVADKGSAKINWSRTCKSTLKLGNAQYTVSGVNALHLGAIFGHVDTMVFYIDHGLINDVDTRSDDDCTPLHFAVARGNASVVKYLCARGCDIDARTANGSSPLHLAARHRRSEVARYLVASGCSVSLDSAGMKPSFYALQSNDETLIEIFKSAESGSREHSSEGHEQEAIPQRKRYRAFSAAFENAILANNMDRCQELVSNGCDLEVPLHSCGGCSPLIKAIKYGRMAIVKWLLDNGASLARVSCGAKPGVSAIHLIFAAPRLIEVLPQCLDTYLRAGGTVLGESQSLVITAAASNNTAGLKLLLEHLVQHKDHCA